MSRNSYSGAIVRSRSIATFGFEPGQRGAEATMRAEPESQLSSDDKNLGWRGLDGLGAGTGAYFTGSPAVLRMVLPNRHRVPVLRLIPTIRHASELFTPWAISRTKRSCLSVNPQPGGLLPSTSIATPK